MCFLVKLAQFWPSWKMLIRFNHWTQYNVILSSLGLTSVGLTQSRHQALWTPRCCVIRLWTARVGEFAPRHEAHATVPQQDKTGDEAVPLQVDCWDQWLYFPMMLQCLKCIAHAQFAHYRNFVSRGREFGKRFLQNFIKFSSIFDHFKAKTLQKYQLLKLEEVLK